MKKKPSILAVDDDQWNLRFIERLITPLGYDIALANNGLEALGMVHLNPPDIVLLDAVMPEMDGFEVARRLKCGADTCAIPIVMVTSLNDVQDRVKALEIGVDDFLTKPVDKIELRARVQSLLKVKAYYDHMRDYQKELESAVAQKTKELQRAFKQVKAASLDTIYRLARAAEYRDEDTGAHLQRMSRYSATIARELGLGQDKVEAILYASPMHDIGKIGIPDSILLKAGKLDSNEWRTMQEHTIIGAEILEGSSTEYVNLGKIIALTHHEKWDGSGYPGGIKGLHIPQAGRIVALADVFDALTTQRPYKEPFSLEKSIDIIEEGRGSHFDPNVTDAFLAALDEIISIKEQFQDKSETSHSLYRQVILSELSSFI